MRSLMHMTTIRRVTLGVAGLLVLGACSETAVPDFNNPGEPDYTNIETLAQLQAQAVGVVDADRQLHDFQLLLDETLGRNFYRLDGAETRYITQTLRGTPPANSNFIGGAIFQGPYQVIRSADLLIDAVDAAADSLPEFSGGPKVEFDANAKASVRGFARTIQAIEYMRLIEQRDTLGVSFYTSPDEVPPIVCKENGLAHVSALLDTALTELQAGAEEFPFDLPSGFDGFDTPETFAQFNRALKAKVEVYRGFDLFARTGGTSSAARPEADRWALTGVNAAALTAALAALDQSFYDPDGDLVSGGPGVFHVYSTSAGDYVNPNFDQSVYRVNPRVVTEAEGAAVTIVGGDSIWSSPDQRLARKVELNGSDDCRSITRSSITTRSCFLDQVNTSNIHPLPILRNDELVLLEAQARFGLGQFAAALAIINEVRAAAGLPTRTAASFGDAAFGTAASREALLDELLRQKRYQLLQESATRWVDYRMFGKLDELGTERGEGAFPVFPFPLAENLARAGNFTKTCQ
jgi:hypothetical protein